MKTLLDYRDVVNVGKFYLADEDKPTEGLVMLTDGMHYVFIAGKANGGVPGNIIRCGMANWTAKEVTPKFTVEYTVSKSWG